MENTVLPYNERFRGADWLSEIDYFWHQIIGLGGIGSHLSFQLSRAGARRVELIDDDIVENHNIGGQLFSHQQIGETKVESTLAMLELLISPEQKNIIYHDKSKVSNLDRYHYNPTSYFVCVDNMETRINLAKSFKDVWSKTYEKIYFESRLSPTGFEIYCVNHDNLDFYLENCLFKDEEADGLTCSFKQTTHVAAALASKLVTIYTNYLTNLALNKQMEGEDVDFFPVPFYYKEDCNLLTSKIALDVESYKRQKDSTF